MNKKSGKRKNVKEIEMSSFSKRIQTVDNFLENAGGILESETPISQANDDSSSNSDSHEPTNQDNKDGQSLVNSNQNITPSIDVSIEKAKHKRKRKSQKRFPDNPELKNEPRMFKYWSQRFDLFERFDLGIKLDRESWFSVTPESVAKEHAALCDETDIVLDGFCGAGGNSIQFAYRCQKVLCLDIDDAKIKLTENNCSVYGVEAGKVTVVKEDYFAFCGSYEERCASNSCACPGISVVFLSPPWGGQDYLASKNTNVNVFDLKSIGMARLMDNARLLRPRLIVVYLPRNTNIDDLRHYALVTDTLDIVEHKSRYKKTGPNKIKAITAVYRLK